MNYDDATVSAVFAAASRSFLSFSSITAFAVCFLASAKMSAASVARRRLASSVPAASAAWHRANSMLPWTMAEKVCPFVAL